MWKCSCYCLGAGNRAKCFLTFPSKGVLSCWGLLKMNFPSCSLESWQLLNNKGIFEKGSVPWSCQWSLFLFCHEGELCRKHFALPCLLVIHYSLCTCKRITETYKEPLMHLCIHPSLLALFAKILCFGVRWRLYISLLEWVKHLQDQNLIPMQAWGSEI